MKSSLTKGMNEQDQKELKAEFLSSYRLRNRYIEMLNEKISNIHSDMLNEDISSSPSWTISQAEKIAQIKAYKKLIALLEN